MDQLAGCLSVQTGDLDVARAGVEESMQCEGWVLGWRGKQQWNSAVLDPRSCQARCHFCPRFDKPKDIALVNPRIPTG